LLCISWYVVWWGQVCQSWYACVTVMAGAPSMLHLLIYMCGGGRWANHVEAPGMHVWWVDGPPTTLSDASPVTAICADATSLCWLERACMCMFAHIACHTIHPHSMGAFMHFRGGCLARGAWHLRGRGGSCMHWSCWHPLAWIVVGARWHACATGAGHCDHVAALGINGMHV
jgi:hypothetical protein